VPAIPKTLEIRLLGELAVLRGGRPLALPASKKTRALLGYLVVTRAPHLRERLCELLWDGPDDPRAALRWSLSKLRPLVDEARAPRLEADRERVAFTDAGADIDLHAVRAALGVSPAHADLDVLRSAATRLRGELLDGLDLPDCFRFHAWCTAERESVRALRVAVLDALADRCPDAEEALKHARARLSIDPLAENAHAAVMRALHRLGRAREALKHHDEALTLLSAELGNQRTGDLARARADILASAGPAPLAAEADASPRGAPASRGASSEGAAERRAGGGRVGTSSGLIGRRRERERIGEAVRRCAAGEAHPVVLLVGEPGIGKSRLIEEIGAQVRAAGGRVLGARAFEAEMVRPYGVWMDALRGLDAGEVPEALRAAVAPLLPSLGAPDAADRNQLFGAVAQLLTGLSGAGRPLAVILDDLHWIDEAGAALLSFVARELGSSRVLLACAARPGDLADNRAALKLVRALDRDRRLERIDLAPLDAPEIAELVGGALDAQRVFDDSGGNPLFALEMARALSQGEDPAESLDELLATRLDALDGRARELLPFAAALGRTFSAELLASAAGMAPADLIAALDELERRGVLRGAAGGTFDFAHDLVRRAAYRGLSEPRRRLVHHQLALALAKLPDPDGTLAGDLLHHAAIAGQLELAARACLRAGDRCLRVCAQAEAERAALRGLQHLASLPSEVRVELEVPLYRVLVFSRPARPSSREQESAVQRAIVAAEGAGRRADVMLGFHLLAMMQWRLDDVDAAGNNSLRAVQVARGSEPGLRARSLGVASRCLLMIERDVPKALAMAREAEELVSQHGLQISEVAMALAMSHRFTGDLARAAEENLRAISMADWERTRPIEQNPWARCVALLELGQIALETGDLAAAERHAGEAAEVARKLGEGMEGPFAEALSALAAYAADRPGARAALDEKLDALRSADSKGVLAYVLATAADLDLAAGRITEARALATEAVAAGTAVERVSEVAAARAVLLRATLAAEDHDAARELRAVLDQPHAALLSARARRLLSLTSPPPQPRST
jgi:DNA-binding SARP family transcriptional activator